MGHVTPAPLHETARSRYLNYALSVITSRALPDIRDGLKPVQRRILYTMFASLRLYPDARYRKSATIVGDTMGKYHPHGDAAIYDAMVRMAQSFSLRDPLVDGHGNFGSIDGDRPAAMRYTEARLQPLAMTLLQELRQDTVPFRPNFDGTLSEPVVVPASVPNLLINGATGIAVGMATNVPPHNLGEVIDGAIYLVDRRLRTKTDRWPKNATRTLVQRYIKGPDFPTGGRILNSEEELTKIYERGEGTVHLRSEHKREAKSRIVITSVPYSVNKSDLIERIAGHIARDRVPQLTDIRDESTDDVRIVMDLKRGTNADAALAYLYKHTPLQTRVHVNMTCLVPTTNPNVSAPQKVNLQRALEQFLTFRLEVVSRRLQHELDNLLKRIHLLEGFEIIFDALDEAIKIIRSAQDRADSSQRLRHRFSLSQEQANAILDTRLYKLSQLEITSVRTELTEKRGRATEIQGLLADVSARWRIVRSELAGLKKTFASPRRTTVAGPDESAYEYSEEDFIVEEDATVIISRSGWIKRQRSYTDLSSIRIREGDEVGWALACATRATVIVWTNFGRAYTMRVNDIVSTTGHGEPLQKRFDFSDKERVVGATTCDSRTLPRVVSEESNELFPYSKNERSRMAPMGYLVACTRRGMTIRMALDSFAELSTRSGRLYMRLEENDKVIGAWNAGGAENICVASKEAFALVFPVSEIPIRSGAGKGVIAMRLGSGDRVLGAALSRHAREGLEVETNRGRREIVRPTKFAPARRGNKGRQIIRLGNLAQVILKPMEVRL